MYHYNKNYDNLTLYKKYIIVHYIILIRNSSRKKNNCFKKYVSIEYNYNVIIFLFLKKVYVIT